MVPNSGENPAPVSRRIGEGSSHLSRRAREIPPFIVMEVLERAFELEKAGRSIIHLEVGEPDFDTPNCICEAGVRAIRDGRTHYTHSLGLLELREAISEWQNIQYGIDIDPGRIVVTTGSSAAMVLAFAALLNPGDEVILTDPGYPCYPKFIRAFEGNPVSIPVFERNHFQYAEGDLEGILGERTKGVILNSPSNPTGTIAAGERLESICSEVCGNGIVISDEIYHGLVYEGRAHSVLEFTEDAIVVNGFSKLFAMTGWRLGYAILPASFVRGVQKLQQNLFISAPDFAQYAGIVALREAHRDVEGMRAVYGRRRVFVLNALERMGLKVAVKPTGAFYIFVNVSSLTDNVYEFSFELLEKAGVAVTPGVDFGANGEGYVRICYANSIENLSEGMERISRFLSSAKD